MNFILPVVSAVLANLAAPNPFVHDKAWQAWLGLFAMAPLMVSLGRSTTSKEGWWKGGIFGSFLMWGHCHSLLDLRGLGGWWWAFWMGIGLLSGLLFGAWGSGFTKVQRRRPHAVWLFMGFFPCGWVTVEWVQDLLVGVATPWSIVLSQTTNLPLLQLASLGGLSLVTWLCLAVSGSLAYAVLNKSYRPAAVMTGVVLVAWLWGASRIEFLNRHSSLVTRHSWVAVLQGATPQAYRLDAKKTVEVFDNYDRLARETQEQTGGKVELFLWPETAAPGLMRFHPVVWPKMQALARDTHAYHVVGVRDATIDERGYPTANFNTAWLIRPDGQLLTVYRKRHLFPIGEYRPWKLGPGLDDFTPGTERITMETPAGKAATPICNEIFFPHDLRRWRNEGADLLLNLTNDGDFERTVQPRQVLAMAVCRAVEMGCWVLRSSNSGISAIIHPSGRILDRAEVGERKALVHSIQIDHEKRTDPSPSSLVTAPWVIGACFVTTFGVLAWAVWS